MGRSPERKYFWVIVGKIHNDENISMKNERNRFFCPNRPDYKERKKERFTKFIGWMCLFVVVLHVKYEFSKLNNSAS
jgi:hypothetical protein